MKCMLQFETNNVIVIYQVHIHLVSVYRFTRRSRSGPLYYSVTTNILTSVFIDERDVQFLMASGILFQDLVE